MQWFWKSMRSDTLNTSKHSLKLRGRTLGTSSLYYQTYPTNVEAKENKFRSGSAIHLQRTMDPRVAHSGPSLFILIVSSVDIWPRPPPARWLMECALAGLLHWNKLWTQPWQAHGWAWKSFGNQSKEALTQDVCVSSGWNDISEVTLTALGEVRKTNILSSVMASPYSRSSATYFTCNWGHGPQSQECYCWLEHCC